LGRLAENFSKSPKSFSRCASGRLWSNLRPYPPAAKSAVGPGRPQDRLLTTKA
jgi:hypothetical protein